MNFCIIFFLCLQAQKVHHKCPLPDKTISVDSIPLEKELSVRLLSVNISSNLLWHDHVMNIAKQTSKKLGFLYRCKSFFNAQQHCLIYKSFIRPCNK